MEKNEIREKIIGITKQILLARHIDFDDVNDDDELYETGIGLDSIAVLTLLSEVEKNFNIEFPDEFWKSKTFSTLKDIIGYLETVHLLK